MTKQAINLGTAPNGAGGDTPRSAFTKVQANIDELYAALGAPASGVLPAALPVIDGGTGSTTAAGARTNLGLKTAALANTLGPVASGDIMESGVNAWGTYERYACGTLILRETRTVNLNVAPGAYVVPALVFAAPTVGAYNVYTELAFYTGIDGAGNNLYGVKQTYALAGLFINSGRDSASTTPSLSVLGVTSANSYVFRCLIVGRWI